MSVIGTIEAHSSKQSHLGRHDFREGKSKSESIICKNSFLNVRRAFLGRCSVGCRSAGLFYLFLPRRNSLIDRVVHAVYYTVRIQQFPLKRHSSSSSALLIKTVSSVQWTLHIVATSGPALVAIITDVSYIMKGSLELDLSCH